LKARSSCTSRTLFPRHRRKENPELPHRQTLIIKFLGSRAWAVRRGRS
jgi:hypothetical protein